MENSANFNKAVYLEIHLFFLFDMREMRCNPFHFWVILHNKHDYSGKTGRGNDKKMCKQFLCPDHYQFVHKSKKKQKQKTTTTFPVPTRQIMSVESL
jgi:hypothetical protein